MKKNYPLKKLTTMRTGGPAKFFLSVKNENELIEITSWAKGSKIKWTIVGEGSNLVPSDKGFRGLVIKNEIEKLKVNGPRVVVGAGNNLLKFINKLNKTGLAGMERMAGIPGTIGGAIYGSAGAYSLEIKDCLRRVKIFDGKQIGWLSKKECRFSYRESIFKRKKNWIIIEAEFRLKRGRAEELQKTSREIIKTRRKKYWPGLLCPGSFFKNIVIKDLKPKKRRERFLSKIEKDKIMYGKVPSGYLLEVAGAKGMEIGGIKVADHHGNLIFNTGHGTSSDIEKLAKILKNKVGEKYGIELEEEVQYL